MIDGLQPWPTVRQPKRGLGDPSIDVPHPAPWRQQLAHGEHHPPHQPPHRPTRADQRETAHLIEETVYACSRCRSANDRLAMACEVCGARFAPLVIQAHHIDPIATSETDGPPDPGNEG